ncbi:MAG: histidine phosphatase family protein [Phycisphaerales bacterium]
MSTVIRLDLVRCGSTAWERDGRLRGETDLPLDESGVEMAEAAAEELAGRPIRLVVHPADEAATETARIVAGRLGARTRMIRDLTDPSLGLLEGMSAADFAARHPSRAKTLDVQPMRFTAPEGEPFDAARCRILHALGGALRRPRGPVVAVLHSLGLGLVRSWLAGDEDARFRTLIDDRPPVEHHVLTPADVAAMRKVEVPASV